MNWDSLGLKSKAGRYRFGAGLLLVLLVCAVLGAGLHARRAAAFKSHHTTAKSTVPAKLNAQSILSSLPIVFEPNLGQAAPPAKFVAHGAGYGLAFDNSGATLALQSSPTAPADVVSMTLAGANVQSTPSAVGPQPGHSNYFIGNDPAQWHTKVPQYARLRYQNVYPGIHLVFYGTQGHLEYDFQVEPGADPSTAQLEFSGARHLSLDKQTGDLIIETAAHALRFNAPHVYQRGGAHTQDIAGRFILHADHRVGFAVGPYDRSRELVIDPVLSYSTYFGGTGMETSPSVASDGVFIYLAGATTSNNLPVASGSTNPPYQPTLKGAQNIFILKLNPQAANGPGAIQYLTYIGGSGMDSTVGIGQNSGVVFVAGNTSSPNFPTTTTAYQTLPWTGSPGPHAFATVVDAFGDALNYSSYLSGNKTDTATGMTIDSGGNLYLTGHTTSTNLAGDSTGGIAAAEFPASTLPEGQAFQAESRAQTQFFVTKVNTTAAGNGSIAYSTYFGGGTPSTGIAVGGGVAVDNNNNLYFTGTTNFINTGSSPLTDFPILNAYQPCLDQPPPNIVVNPPTCTNTSVTNTDAFLAKLYLNPNGNSQLIFSTYFGGSSNDSSTAVTIDSGAANIYMTGQTTSSDITIPTGIAPFQPCPNNPAGTIPCPTSTSTGTDAYVARFNNLANTTTTSVVQNTYFTYFGGSLNESGLAITVDTTNDAYITGPTTSTNLFPDLLTVQNPNFTPIQSTLGAGAVSNAFIARIDTTTVTSSTNPGNSYVTYFGGGGMDRGTSVALDPSLSSYFAGDTTSSNFPVLKAYQPQLKGIRNAWVAKLGTAPNLTITGVPTYGTGLQSFTAGNPATFTYTIANDGDPATNITVTDDFSSAGIPLTFMTASITGGSCSNPTSTAPLVCSLAVLNTGNTATMTVTVVPAVASTYVGGIIDFNGGLATVTFDANPNGNQFIVPAQATTFSMSVSPTAQTVIAGNSPPVPFVALISPDPTFGSSISLACTVPPAATGATCAASTLSVTPGSSPTSVKINVGTQARPIPITSNRRSGPIYAFWLGLPGVAFLGIGMGGSKRRRRICSFLALVAIAVTFALEPGCSSGTTTTPPQGTPPGTYTFTVTGTSGTFSRSSTFTLQVN